MNTVYEFYCLRIIQYNNKMLFSNLQSLSSYEDYITTPTKNIYIYEDMIEINKKPCEIILKEEKQETGL